MIDLREFEKFVLPEVLLCPWPVMSYNLITTIVDFAEDTWVFSKSFNYTVATANIVTTINDYCDIVASEYVTDKQPIAVETFLIDGLIWRLKHVELYDDIDDDNLDSVRESDQKMFSFPSNSTLRIHELVDAQELFLKVIYKPLYDITEIDDIIYNDHLNAIVAGAKGKLLMIPNQPWTNPSMASYYVGIYKKYASEAKAKIQRGFTREPGSVKWREFGV